MLITMMLFLIPNNSYCCHPLNDYMICMGPGLHKPQGQVIFTSRLPECKIWLHLIEALSLSRPEPMASLVFSNEVLTENEYIWIWLIDSCVQYYSTFRKLIWALWILHNSVDIPEQQWGWGFLLHILPRLRRVGLDQDWQTLCLAWWAGPWKERFFTKNWHGDSVNEFLVTDIRDQPSSRWNTGVKNKEHLPSDDDVFLCPERHPMWCGWLFPSWLSVYLHNQLI